MSALGPTASRLESGSFSVGPEAGRQGLVAVGSTAVVLGIYVALWIVEGAFRKWVPGTSTIFYVLRDGYAVLALVWLASRRDAARRRLPWWVFAAVLLLAAYLALQFALAPAASPTVLLFGLRSYVGPLLFTLICYKYGSFDSLLRSAGVIAIAAPVELALTVVQVVSPAAAFVNIQVGGAPTDFVNNGSPRATGTFSAPSGMTAYLLVAAVIGLWWTLQRSRRFAGWSVLACVVGATALSGARSSVLNLGILVAVYVLYSLVKPSRQSIAGAVALVALLVVALAVLQATLPTVLQSFGERFVTAGNDEDSSSRLFDAFTAYLSQSPPLLGDGMGSRSNAGIALGSSATWIENDSLRWVAELGVAGYLLFLARTALAFALVYRAVTRVRRDGPAVTMSRAALAVLLLIGSINSTPTLEGAFAILLGILVLGERTELPALAGGPAPRAQLRGALR